MNKKLTTTLLSTFALLTTLPISVGAQEYYQPVGNWGSAAVTNCTQCSTQTTTYSSYPVANNTISVTSSEMTQSCPNCNVPDANWQTTTVYSAPIAASQPLPGYASNGFYSQPTTTYPHVVPSVQSYPSQNTYYPPANAYASSATYPVVGSLQAAQTFTGSGPISRVASGMTGGLAQRKASRMAQMNLKGHLGGSLGSARYEGVGWSNVSSQSAIQACCYWGQKTPVEIGVARGADGFWYACVLYN